MGEKFLVTGASGCIGSWVLRHLIDKGIDFVASDVSEDRSRTGLLMTDSEAASIIWEGLDVRDTKAVSGVVGDHGITRIVHLAGLQVPFAKANPPLGAEVNVTGTVNIFEAARAHGVAGLAYASSIAVFGPADAYPPGPVPDAAPKCPDTLYGAYKLANEETARVFWQDWQVASVGLRPGVWFGIGLD